MAITVSPSKQLDVDTHQAEDGDLLRLTLEDKSTLIIVWREAFSSGLFFLEHRHMPPEVREHAKNEVRRVLADEGENLEDWVRQYGNPDMTLPTQLYAMLTNRCQVHRWKVGERPDVYLPDAFGSLFSYRPQKWTFGADVVSIEPVSSWTGELEAYRIEASLM